MEFVSISINQLIWTTLHKEASYLSNVCLTFMHFAFYAFGLLPSSEESEENPPSRMNMPRLHKKVPRTTLHRTSQ